MGALYKNYPGILEDFIQGNTIPLTFSFTDDEDLPIDITGYALYLYFSEKRSGQPVAFEINFPIVDGPAGVFAGYITDSQTLNMRPGVYYYSIKYIKPDGMAFLLDIGKVYVQMGINPRVE